MAICVKCGETVKGSAISRHHIFPKRWFGKGKKNNFTVDMCKPCHQGPTGIEKMIEKAETVRSGERVQRLKWVYVDILARYLKGW